MLRLERGLAQGRGECLVYIVICEALGIARKFLLLRSHGQRRKSLCCLPRTHIHDRLLAADRAGPGCPWVSGRRNSPSRRASSTQTPGTPPRSTNRTRRMTSLVLPRTLLRSVWPMPVKGAMGGIAMHPFLQETGLQSPTFQLDCGRGLTIRSSMAENRHVKIRLSFRNLWPLALICALSRRHGMPSHIKSPMSRPARTQVPRRSARRHQHSQLLINS